jgi:hypothetical protein
MAPHNSAGTILVPHPIASIARHQILARVGRQLHSFDEEAMPDTKPLTYPSGRAFLQHAVQQSFSQRYLSATLISKPIS